MKLGIEWTDDALACLLRIYCFYADELVLPDVADKAVKAIHNSADILENTPEAGRPAEDLEPEQRELFVKFGDSGFACVYEVWKEQGFVLILAVKRQKDPGYVIPW